MNMKYSLFFLLTAFSVSLCAAPAPADKAAKEKAKQEAKAAAAKQQALQKQAHAECAKVMAEMDPLIKDFAAAMKKNDLKAASEKADRLISLSQFVGCDGKTRPRYDVAWIFERTILPGFYGKKLSGAELAKKYYAQYDELMKKAGKNVSYDQKMKWIEYADAFALEDRAPLKKQADELLAEYVKAPGAKPKDIDKAILGAYSRRAGMFNGEDFADFAAQAEKYAGNDKAKRILFYQIFLGARRGNGWTLQAEQKKLKAQFMADKSLTDLDRALNFTDVYGLTLYSFAEKEALYEKALKTPGLSENDARSIYSKIVALERSGLNRSWIAETPMRYDGIFTVSSPDPVCYAKAKAAQQKLIDTFKVDQDEKKKAASLQELNRLYLGMLSLNYTGQNYADVRATADRLEKALPELKDKWQICTTGYRAASAYFEEDFETAYKLFTSIPVDEYRKDKDLWAKIVEPYLRTCVAVKKYDEACLLSPDINKYLIANWEFWHRTRYQRMFSELAKKCKPETVEAVKNAGKKK